MQVVALIHEGNVEFAAAFPDFPGAVAIAQTLEDVVREAETVLARHAGELIEDGLALPPVRSLSQLSADEGFRADAVGAMIVLIPFTPPTHLARLAAAIDATLLARVDAAARAAGETRSTYVAEALRRRLAADTAPAAAPVVATRPENVQDLMESIRRSIAVIEADAGAKPDTGAPDPSAGRSARPAAPSPRP